MPVPINIPKLGMTMTEASVTRWLVREGDSIDQGATVAEIETDKIAHELEAPASGIIAGLRLTEGQAGAVAEPIAWILLEGEAVDDIPQPGKSDDTQPGATDPRANDGAAMASSACSPSRTQRIRSSPSARRLAEELGVDLNHVAGTGPGERIVKEDVLRAADGGGDSHVPDNQESKLVPWSPMRQAIISHVNQSVAIPQIVLYAAADASALVELRNHDRTIAYEDAIVACASRALRDHRYVNASYEDHGARLYTHVNIGVAVAVDQGLLIPVIRCADTRSLHQISAERQRLIGKVRSGAIAQHDMVGATFTLTNLGMYSIDRFTALISPPQAAILSIGRIQHIAHPAEGGGVVFRPTIEFGLTLDHRVADGAAGAAFLRDFITRIESINLEGNEDDH